MIMHVEGILDRESLPVFIDAYNLNIKNNKQVVIDLKNLKHICREGIEYLERREINISNKPGFIKQQGNDK